MKSLLVALVILTATVTACGVVGAGESDKTEQKAEIQVFIIEDGKVTCYWKKVGYAGGLSCLPTNQTQR